MLEISSVTDLGEDEVEGCDVLSCFWVGHVGLSVPGLGCLEGMRLAEGRGKGIVVVCFLLVWGGYGCARFEVLLCLVGN